MAVSTVGVADAASPDKYLHTHQRTISGTAREDTYVQQGESAYPTYSAVARNISIATANDHVLQIMGDGSNYSRLRQVQIQLGATYSTAIAVVVIGLYRLSTAGTGGSALTPAPHDTSDTYGGGAMTLPSSKGTEGALLHVWSLPNYGSGSVIFSTGPTIWTPSGKPVIFGTATSSGLAFKVIVNAASTTIDINAEFAVTSYL